VTYPYWTDITTRWMDNDMYGHVNNAHYYSYFDTVLTHWLVNECGFDPGRDDVIGLCVESQCKFHAPLAFPERIAAGLRVGRVGRSSVRYEIALRGEGRPEPAATGYFVHVYVDRRTRASTAIPERLLQGLGRLRPEVAR
jgi:acyl-CoA thioester hydrolase